MIVFNYDAPDWPADLRLQFEHYIENGGGLVIVHAADNAFPNWPAFNQMAEIGGWRNRNETSGPLWYFKDGKLVSDTSPGSAGSHGNRLPFQIKTREPEHPIMKGLGNVWMHAADELYATLRGPGKNMTVLATAYSDPNNKGTGRDEPMLTFLTYGKGRIFHTTLTSGNLVSDDPDYSPDGKYIYFNSDRSGSMQIWRMRPDGSGPEQVTSDDLVNWTPHISPDGKSMVFLSYEKGVTGHPPNKDVVLRLMSMDDKKVMVLASIVGGLGTINVPSWAPDSHHLALSVIRCSP